MLLRRTAATLVAALCLASCDNPAGSDPDPKPAATPLPAKLEVVSGGGQQATVGQELPQPLVVRLLDDRGRPVRNHIVNFRVTAGGGAVFAGAALTNDDGEARERWTLGTAARDTQRVEARAVDPATGQPLVFGTFSGFGVADAPASIAPVGPAALTGSPGAAMPVAVRVQDRFGNRVAGATVAWQAPQGEGTVTPAQGVTDSTGLAAAHWTLAYSVGAQTMTAFAGTSLSTQFTAAAETPEGSRLVAVSGGEQLAVAGTALQPLVVRLQNAAGQPIRNAAVAWTVTGGEITPGSAVTDAQGQVTASWTPGTMAMRHTATANTAGATPAVFAARVRAAAPAQLQKVSGEGQMAFTGGELPVGMRVIVVDAYGNPVAGHEVRWRIVSGGGSVSPAAALTSEDGLTETRWRLGAAAGQQALAAEAGTLGTQFLATATATPPPPPPPAPTVRIVSPADGSRVGDSFRITATAVTDEGVAEVAATVADRSFPLALANGEWSGTVSFAGLPAGPQTVTVTARSTSGVAGTATATYNHDVPPP